MTTEQIRAHLATRAYKPGWEWVVYDGDWEGQHLVIRTTVPDANQTGRPVFDPHAEHADRDNADYHLEPM